MAAVDDREERGRLAEVLGALSHPVRLALLDVLQQPHTLGEIVVHTDGGADGPPRPISRQGVRDHLDRLLRVGLVHTNDAGGGRGARYVVNPQTVYALSETLRRLSSLTPAEEVDAQTVAGLARLEPFQLASSALIVVKGPREGQVHRLVAPDQGRREWVIGRRRGLDIVLDHDMYVSTENSLLTWENGIYSIRDLYESRNGTYVNFTRLDPLDRRALRTGDLVQVGQTTLLFRA